MKLLEKYKSIVEKFTPKNSIIKIIRVLNSLIKDKIIEDYSIGGATALMHYSIPMLTEDVDVFISLKNQELLINFEPLYKYLKNKYNAKIDKEYIIINEIPIQFLLPQKDSLTDEAFNNSNIIDIERNEVKIFQFEYLIAIMIQLNKPKYRARLFQVIQENKYDKIKLNKILSKYNLLDKWKQINLGLVA